VSIALQECLIGKPAHNHRLVRDWLSWHGTSCSINCLAAVCVRQVSRDAKGS
jgi:hypothetical protein